MDGDRGNLNETPLLNKPFTYLGRGVKRIMKTIITIFILLTTYSVTSAQARNCSVLLNHFYVVMDTQTYQAILGSEILNTDFSYSYEKIRNWGGGIYLIGRDNYIEILHPNSISGENLPEGFTWICHTSLAANCIEKYTLPNSDRIVYTSDENFDELSVFTQDAVYMSNAHSLFTTREMNKAFYESWTKKPFNDSLNFLTNDYNKPAESDSAKDYLFKNVTGIEVSLNTKDSVSVIQYFNLIGYSLESPGQNRLKLTNSTDFIELHFSKNVKLATISAIHFELNNPIEPKQISVGSSEIILEGNTGKWIINKQRLAKPKNN